MAEFVQQTGLLAIDLPINNVVDIGPLGPGVTVLVTRAGIGYARVTGICLGVAPPLAAGTLNVQQSNDGITWDHVDSFPVVVGNPAATFDISIVARYVQVTFDDPIGGMLIRLHGLLRSA